MIDYQPLVEEIRSFLQSADQTANDRLKELAIGYAEACTVANQRLRRCEEYLRKGLMSEAIHLAQGEPVLLDMVAALDFAERPQWDDMAVFYALPTAPKLLMATAEALNEAYTTVRPLEQLLRKHRFLALSRASLPSRLAVMRKIALVDSANPIWRDDIGDFEKARVRQLEGEIKEAQKDGNAAALDRLLSEVRQGEWLVSPPLQLIQAVEDLAQEKEQGRTRQTLRALELELHDAVAAFDVPMARRLRDRWNDEALGAGLNLNDPLWGRVAPAFDWLADQERRLEDEKKYKIALLDLEKVLDGSASREELDRRYRALLTFDGGIPEAVDTRYRAGLEKTRRAVQRKKRSIGLGIAAAAFLLAGCAAFWIYQARQAGQLTDALQTARRLREAGNIEGAAEFLQQLAADQPRLAATPEMKELQWRVDADSAREKERAAAFQEALRETEAISLDDNEPAALAKAKGLARSAQEKQALQELLTLRKEQGRELLKKREESFQSRMAVVNGHLQEVEKRVADSPDDPKTRTALDSVHDEIDHLRLEGKKLSPELREAPETLLARWETAEKLRSQQSIEEEFINHVIRKLLADQNATGYANELQKYIKQFPTLPRARAFQKVLAEKRCWQPPLEWARLVENWRGTLDNFTPGSAAAAVGKIQPFLSVNPDFVDTDAGAKYLQCLEAIAQQDEKKEQTAAAELRAVFSHFLVKNLWMLKENDRTYYLLQDVSKKIDEGQSNGATFINYRYLTGLTGNESQRNAELRKIQKYGRAGQSLVADEAARMPDNFAAKTWEQGTLRLARMIQDSKDMDPVEQLILLRKVLELASRGSYPLSLALDKYRNLAQAANLDLTKVAWPTPGDDDAENVRHKARLILKDVPPLASATEETARHKLQLETAITKSKRDLVGLLTWEKNKGWTCRGNLNLPGNRTLQVAIPATNQKVIWKTIGTLVDGHAHLEKDDYALGEGRVVFAAK